MSIENKKVSFLKLLEKKYGPLRLSSLIRSTRMGEEMTQVEFAKLLGISKSHLNDIEKGRKIVSPERAARFALILGYSPKQYIQLALEEQLAKAGLKYTVQIKSAS